MLQCVSPTTGRMFKLLNCFLAVCGTDSANNKILKLRCRMACLTVARVSHQIYVNPAHTSFIDTWYFIHRCSIHSLWLVPVTLLVYSVPSCIDHYTTASIFVAFFCHPVKMFLQRSLRRLLVVNFKLCMKKKCQDLNSLP